MNMKKATELARLSKRADFESHKFNSGFYDQGILRNALKAQKQHEQYSLKKFNSLSVMPASLDKDSHHSNDEEGGLCSLESSYQVSMD